MGGGGGTSGFGNPGYWVLDIEKLHQGEYWTNRYILQAPTLAEAVTAGNLVVVQERQIHNNSILITRARVSDGQPDTDVYQVTNVNQFGLTVLGTESMLPLFNVVRVDFNTAGGGRPSRKYIRGYLLESNVTFNTILPAAITHIMDNYVTQMVALAAFCDVDGQEITSGSVFPQVGMRQLRRGSKRKAVVAGP